MGEVRWGVPLELVGAIARATGARSAVETGSYKGDSAAALRTVVDTVTSIELSPELHSQATARHQSDGLTFLCGDSAELLPDVVAGLAGPAVFWLDGHWSAGDTAGESRECPVLDEIAVINRGDQASSILVDDARMFLGAPLPPHDPEQWPTLLEVTDALRAHGRHVTLIEDVLVAVPPAARAAVDQYFQTRTSLGADRPSAAHRPRWRHVAGALRRRLRS